MVTRLTPEKLVKFLAKYYNYIITELTAGTILNRCEEEYDEQFTEDELISVVECYL